MARTLQDSFTSNWAPFFNSEGKLQPDVTVAVECGICRSELAIDKVSDDHREACTMLPCGHVFGLGCLQHWFHHSPSCPICRKQWRHSGCFHPIKLNELQGGRNFNLNNLPPIFEVDELPACCAECGATGFGDTVIQDPQLAEDLRRLHSWEQMEVQLLESAQELSRQVDSLGEYTDQLSQLRQMVHDLRPHITPEMAAVLNNSNSSGNGARIVAPAPSPAGPPRLRRVARHNVFPPVHPNNPIIGRRGGPVPDIDYVSPTRAAPFRPHIVRHDTMGENQVYGVRTFDPNAYRPDHPGAPTRCVRPAPLQHEFQHVQHLEEQERELLSPFRAMGLQDRQHRRPPNEQPFGNAWQNYQTPRNQAPFHVHPDARSARSARRARNNNNNRRPFR